MFESSTRDAKNQLCVKICSGEASGPCLCRRESLITAPPPVCIDRPFLIRNIVVRCRAAWVLSRMPEEVVFYKRNPQEREVG